MECFFLVLFLQDIYRNLKELKVLCHFCTLKCLPLFHAIHFCAVTDMLSQMQTQMFPLSKSPCGEPSWLWGCIHCIAGPCWPRWPLLPRPCGPVDREQLLLCAAPLGSAPSAFAWKALLCTPIINRNNSHLFKVWLRHSTSCGPCLENLL